MEFLKTILWFVIIAWLAFWGVFIITEIVSIGGILAFLSAM